MGDVSAPIRIIVDRIIVDRNMQPGSWKAFDKQKRLVGFWDGRKAGVLPPRTIREQIKEVHCAEDVADFFGAKTAGQRGRR